MQYVPTHFAGFSSCFFPPSLPFPPFFRCSVILFRTPPLTLPAFTFPRYPEHVTIGL